MTPDSPSKSSRLRTRLVLVLSVLLLGWGLVSFGLDTSVNPDFWSHVFGRVGGPMTFRFILQPTMALIAATPAGIADARENRLALAPVARLCEGLRATARIILLGLSMDMIYQIRVLHHFYPLESLVVAMALALVPYIVLRIVVAGIARLWFKRKAS